MHDEKNAETQEIEIAHTEELQQNTTQEAVSLGGADIPEVFHSDEEMEDALSIVERRNTFITKVTMRALKTLLPTDFHDFEGKPLLQGVGAQRLIKFFGISVTDIKRHPKRGYEAIAGDTAHRQRVTYSATFTLGSMTILGEGRRDTHNQFLGKAHGKFKDIADINLPFLDASAKTAMFRDGIGTLLGLKGLSWEYLAELGFTKAQTTGHTYKKPEQKQTANAGYVYAAPETSSKHLKAGIGKMLMQMSGDDAEGAADILESITEYEKEGKPMKGKRELEKLSIKQTPVVHDQVKKQYTEFMAARVTNKTKEEEMPKDELTDQLGF